MIIYKYPEGSSQPDQSTSYNYFKSLKNEFFRVTIQQANQFKVSHKLLKIHLQQQRFVLIQKQDTLKKDLMIFFSGYQNFPQKFPCIFKAILNSDFSILIPLSRDHLFDDIILDDYLNQLLKDQQLDSFPQIALFARNISCLRVMSYTKHHKVKNIILQNPVNSIQKFVDSIDAKLCFDFLNLQLNGPFNCNCRIMVFSVQNCSFLQANLKNSFKFIRRLPPTRIQFMIKLANPNFLQGQQKQLLVLQKLIIDFLSSNKFQKKQKQLMKNQLSYPLAVRRMLEFRKMFKV